MSVKASLLSSSHQNYTFKTLELIVLIRWFEYLKFFILLVLIVNNQLIDRLTDNVKTLEWAMMKMLNM